LKRHLHHFSGIKSHKELINSRVGTTDPDSYLVPVLRIQIRIRIRIHRINMFLGLPDPVPDPSIIMQI
jgi:hypothetical protein